MAERSKPLFALLAAAETSPSVLYGLYDVLYSVGAVWPDMTMGEPGPEALDVRIVAAGAEPFRCTGNVMVEPHASIDELPLPDVALVCDMYTPIHTPPRGRYGREIAWLQRIHAQGAMVASVCSGSVLLAEAGLLDGRDAAGHWAYEDLFRRCYPRVRLRRELVLCLTAEPDGIVTAGAVTAWQDLALHLISRFCGRRQALQTAKVFLLSGHDDGQLPYAAMPRPLGQDAVICDCQGWIAENYSVPKPVERMVARSGLKARTFARRFQAATGYLPIDYVLALRVEEAKQMLEIGDLGIDEVGTEVGYADAASFRRTFKRQSGLTPGAYRRKFKGIAQAATEGG